MTDPTAAGGAERLKQESWINVSSRPHSAVCSHTLHNPSKSCHCKCTLNESPSIPRLAESQMWLESSMRDESLPEQTCRPAPHRGAQHSQRRPWKHSSVNVTLSIRVCTQTEPWTSISCDFTSFMYFCSERTRHPEVLFPKLNSKKSEKVLHFCSLTVKTALQWSPYSLSSLRLISWHKRTAKEKQ